MRHKALSDLIDVNELFTLPTFKHAFCQQQIKRVTLKDRDPYLLYACGVRFRLYPDDTKAGVTIRFRSSRHLEPFRSALRRDTDALGYGLIVRVNARLKTLSLY